MHAGCLTRPQALTVIVRPDPTIRYPRRCRNPPSLERGMFSWKRRFRNRHHPGNRESGYPGASTSVGPGVPPGSRLSAFAPAGMVAILTGAMAFPSRAGTLWWLPGSEPNHGIGPRLQIRCGPPKSNPSRTTAAAIWTDGVSRPLPSASRASDCGNPFRRARPDLPLRCRARHRHRLLDLIGSRT